jgi:uridine kinase
MMRRSQLLDELTTRITRIKLPHPTRVAVDGVDAAGKTTLAQELVGPLQAHGRPVIRASIDGFHNPAHIRHGRGSTSPEGYYYDSFDYQRLTESLLAPLGPDGSREYRSGIFDYRTDLDVQCPIRVADENAVLLFDGVFLLRPELMEYWDFTIFVEAAFETTIARAVQRDAVLFGSTEEVRNRYERRYIPGQKLYLNKCRPKDRVTVVVDNNDPLNPMVV